MGTSLKLAIAVTSLVVIGQPALATSDAATLARQAEKALAKGRADKAIPRAEAAVAISPQDAGLRMLLGRVYLASGRFQSAAASFADALALDPTRDGAALSLTLARLGAGDVEGARAVVASHGETFAAGDRGLALALTGDVGTAVPLLEAAVRDGGDAKTRQNLALAYALAGRWTEAKLMASYDLDPATLSQRIMQWSQLAREQQSATRIAALLGVKPSEDAGMPVRLALRAPSEPAPIPAVAPAEEVAVAVAPPPPVAMAESLARASVPVTVPVQTGRIQFAPFSPVVQALPVRAPASKTVAAVSRSGLSQRAGGRYAVQIGAYQSLGVAQASWNRDARKIGMLRDFTPSTAKLVQRGGAVLHRLSLSGFATRGEAVQVCETLRMRGGSCFVRSSAGDLPLRWVMRGAGTRLAAR